MYAYDMTKFGACISELLFVVVVVLHLLCLLEHLEHSHFWILYFKATLKYQAF